LPSINDSETEVHALEHLATTVRFSLGLAQRASREPIFRAYDGAEATAP
jgi:hypothetical protein